MNLKTVNNIKKMNSIFTVHSQNLNWTNQSLLNEDVRIDDFSDIFGSIEIKIIWILSWIMFQSFTNTIFFFVIRFEKYGG